ncbi:hypothetical protein [Ornithinimicrobium cryptoxanthini]|uniref:Uncharacterized protein n=1 Tax=Ornithinimicrobium cryptoxanthini TaxID=2934161 RepID=A0ABY4YG44_9MICO|nr:hypothetical protein [Ornithinimicrobium cryptoxanthini]USQ75746.1 hypothetical protein NF557_14195 [Ornithinimicrobium cryptoxanthini]
MNSTGVEITAGLGGFLVVFFLAIVLILLGMDLSKRLRRLKHQEQLRLEEEEAASEKSAGSAEAGEPDGKPERG